MPRRSARARGCPRGTGRAHSRFDPLEHGPGRPGSIRARVTASRAARRQPVRSLARCGAHGPGRHHPHDHALHVVVADSPRKRAIRAATAISSPDPPRPSPVHRSSWPAPGRSAVARARRAAPGPRPASRKPRPPVGAIGSRVISLDDLDRLVGPLGADLVGDRRPGQLVVNELSFTASTRAMARLVSVFAMATAIIARWRPFCSPP